MNINNNWFDVKRISANVYLIDDNGWDNIYLINGSKKSLLLDTGWGLNDLVEIVSELTDLPLIVVNTHGHPDHISGDYLFEDIYINKKEIPLFKKSFNEEKRRWALKRFRGVLPDGFDPEKWINESYNNIIPIENGHTFDLGDRKIEVVAIPGHSPGSIGLIDENERMLFSGDSIVAGHIWMHLEDSTKLSTFLDSLKTVKANQHKFDQILPGHVKTPVDAEIQNELIAGVEAILSGEKEGIYHKKFVGEGLISHFDSCSIVYK